MEMDEYRRYRLILDAAMAVACIGYLIAIAALGLDTEVMSDRFWKNAEPIFHGEIPNVEYPPFALVFMIIPRLFGWTPFAYNIAFVAEVFAFMAIGLYYTDRLAVHFGRDRKRCMLAYSALLVILLEFVVDRFDIFPMVLSLMAFYYFVKDRHALSFAILAIAMMTKLYPAILVPILLLTFVIDNKWGYAVKQGLIFVAVTAAIVIPCLIIDSNLITNFLGYHSDRPLQIESVAASIVYVFVMFGLTSAKITSAEDPGSFGSDNLVGAVPDAIAGFLSPLVVVLILAVCGFFLYLLTKVPRERWILLASYAILIAISVFIIFGKVFSAQYLIWIVPFVVMVMMFKQEVFKNDLFKFFILILVFTQANFVYNVGILRGGSNINEAGMMIILIRNLLMIAMLYVSLKEMYSLSKTEEESSCKE